MVEKAIDARRQEAGPLGIAVGVAPSERPAVVESQGRIDVQVVPGPG